MSTLTLTLTDELDAIEAELAPIRCDTHGCPETRRRVLDLIGRAVAIRRKLGLLPYTSAGLSPVVATRIDLVDGRVVVAITHLNECDDDTITLGLASDPGVAALVPADLFEDYRELLADCVDVNAEADWSYRHAKGWA